MRKFLSIPKSTKLVYQLLFLLVLPIGSFVANAQVTTLQNWSVLYNNTATNQQTVSYTVPTGSNTNRVLAVAIASSRSNTGSRSVTITYGGRTMTLAAGDMASTTPRQHTAIYYLDEAGLDLANNSNLVFTVSSGTTTVTTVWAAVFDYVDQTTPLTNTRNYNSGTNTAGTFVFGTALNINANDQAVLVISSLRSGNTSPRTITFPTNFTSVDEETWTTGDGVRNAVGNRTIPTTNTSSTCSTSMSGNSLGSMTGVSFKGCVQPTANAGSALVAICQGGTSAALGGSVGGSATGGTWSSSVSGGTFNPSATNLNATWTPPANYSGTATLTLTSSGGSCGVATASKTLVVNPLPTAVTASATVSSICSGSTFGLSSSATSNSSSAVTLINENFNGAATGWSTANTSTGGTPANAAWSSRGDGYNVCPTCGASESLSSNDSSNFYLTDSDRQGSGGTTATILQSPSFSTVGLTAASLNFFHYYRDFDGTDFAYVEVSTNGTNWTTLNTYTSTQGGATGFVPVTVNLSSYLNQPTVSIRFRYAAVWGYYWAIDNVSVSGTLSTPPAPTFAWTSTPSGFTSSVQNPTGVTQTVATVYTVTATNSFGCTASASTTSVAITPATVGGSVSGSANICAGANSGLLTLSGHTGSIVRWESAVSPFTTWTPIANTNTTYTSGSLTETTRFRAIIQSGDCAQASSSSATITVTAPPSAGTLSGAQSICSNGTTTFSSSVTGGTWTSGNTAVANINNTSGIVTPVAAGTATMTYTVTGTGGCTNATATRTVTVTTAPTAGTLSGTQSICSNGTATFSSSVAGGTWTSSDVAVATINNTSGVVTPVAAGTATMTYTVTGTGGCANATATRTVTVTTAPSAGTLSGTQSICSNGTTTFSSSVAGGTWTSGNTAVATINNTSGVVTPVAAGTATMTYTVTGTGGCTNATATRTVTVTTAPSAGTLSGTQSICSNGTTTFSSSVAGGTWTSGNTAVATINNTSGVVTPVAAGTATMTYTVTGTGGCTNATATRTVTVTTAPTAGTLSGTQSICSNGTTTFSSSVAGGAWTSSDVAVATINNTSGVVTPVAAGTATMTYTVTGTGGCANATATRTVTVTTAPSAGTLSGTQSICSNGTTTFSSSVAGGTWTSGNTAVATINNTSGIVTPVAAGTATMTYTVTGTGGCANATATRTVTVTTAPSAGTLSGTQSICSTGTTTLSSSVSGGAWTSSDVAVATINNTSGVVTPVAAGTATMTYTVTGTGGCANATATRTVTVTAAPSAGTLSGTQSICFNDTTTFSSSVAGGTWTSGNTAVATINNTSGVVTPVAAGTATMTYTVTGTGGCANATATRTVTISPLAVGGSVSGSATICSGANSGVLTLSGHTGTVVRWESSVSPFTTWTPIANTATTYTSGALTQETKFRAVLQSGSCSEAFSSEATLSFSTTTWNGTAWSNGNPAANKTLIIAGNYTSPGATYDLQGCSLTVQNNAVVTIVPQDSVILSGPLTVATGSTMTFEAKAHLIQSGTTNQNSGNVVVKANSSPIKRLDYTLWSAPVAGQQLQAFSPLTLANRFYNYDSNTNFYTVVASPSTSSFEAAKGVLIRVANNHSASQPQAWTGTFTGVPNNGTYTIPLANFGPGKRFTLVGNPYASPIDPEAFITNANNAASITGTLYLWRKTNGSNKPSYCTFNLGGFITNGENRANEVANLPYQVIQTGQGFFVEGTGAGSGNVVFDNTMRIDDHTNSFLRTANTANTSNSVERNRIWLNVTNTAGAFSQTMIGYVANATNGYDLNYDGKYINDGEIALASILNAEPYAIQCKALPFVATDVIPLQFTATTAGNYSIAIDRVDGLFSAGQNVYLRDNVSGTVHNLTAGAYSFASDSGNFNARFEVLFQSSTLGVNDPVLNENQVVIYKTPTNEISINTGNFVMDNVMIYDLAGRLLYQQKDINNSQALIKVGFATEVLLVKIKTQDGKSVTKKVMFQRTTLKKDLKISTIQLAEDE